MTLDARVKALDDIRTALLFDMVVDLEPRLDFGAGPLGQRVLFGSAGGKFEGPKLRGEILQGGGDWTLFRPNDVMTLDVRLSLKTADGALIYMTYGGRWVTPPELRTEMADPATRYYFRTNPLFETGGSQYAWLNDIVCVGQGYLIERGIAYKVFQVL